MPDILVVGSLNADLVVRAPRFPEPGETISGEDLRIIPGGKGANQAVAAARQSASVGMVGRVGSDSFGPELINNLKQNNVDTSHVQVDAQSATGTASCFCSNLRFQLRQFYLPLNAQRRMECAFCSIPLLRIPCLMN